MNGKLNFENLREEYKCIQLQLRTYIFISLEIFIAYIMKVPLILSSNIKTIGNIIDK